MLPSSGSQSNEVNTCERYFFRNYPIGGMELFQENGCRWTETDILGTITFQGVFL